MATGIRDKVAILGMGCAHFGERWNDDAEKLMVEAYVEALADAGVETSQIEAAWLGVGFDAVNIGPSGIPLAMALRLNNVPVTKIENYCASGTDAFRGAVYAVASGAADIALALGVEKLKDTGYGGLPVRSRGTMFDMVSVVGSAPGALQFDQHLGGLVVGLDRSAAAVKQDDAIAVLIVHQVHAGLQQAVAQVQLRLRQPAFDARSGGHHQRQGVSAVRAREPRDINRTQRRPIQRVPDHGGRA